MNTSHFVASIVLATTFVSAATDEPVAAPDWEAVRLLWREYANSPSAEGAAVLLETLPNRRLTVSERPDTQTSDELYWGLSVLRARMRQGEPRAARIAFRYLHFSDAAFSYDVRLELGMLADSQPRLFLSELARCRPEFSDERDPIEMVVFVEPDDMLEGGESAVHGALLERSARLRSVVDEPLIPLRDECIALIEHTARPPMAEADELSEN